MTSTLPPGGIGLPIDAPPAIEASGYAVKLSVFEGPLDLLLHLIRQNEVEITDIPIAVITKQYLDYLELMKSLDLDVAGEFLLMAATLMHIKSRLLLPVEEEGEGLEEGEDPREELVRQLQEYQQFKEAGLTLQEFKPGVFRRVLVKETLLGVLNGAVVGLVAAVAMVAYAIHSGADQPAVLGVVVLLAMTGACLASGVSRRGRFRGSRGLGLRGPRITIERRSRTGRLRAVRVSGGRVCPVTTGHRNEWRPDRGGRWGLW